MYQCSLFVANQFFICVYMCVRVTERVNVSTVCVSVLVSLVSLLFCVFVTFITVLGPQLFLFFVKKLLYEETKRLPQAPFSARNDFKTANNSSSEFTAK